MLKNILYQELANYEKVFSVVAEDEEYILRINQARTALVKTYTVILADGLVKLEEESEGVNEYRFLIDLLNKTINNYLLGMDKNYLRTLLLELESNIDNSSLVHALTEMRIQSEIIKSFKQDLTILIDFLE